MRNFIKCISCISAFVIAMYVGSFAQAASDLSPEGKRFLTLHWTIVKSTDAIDPIVLSALRSRFGDDPRLANPGEPFNPVDVIDLNNSPMRRLLLAGHARKRWFVVYEHGGRGYHWVLVMFNTSVYAAEPTLLARGWVVGTHIGWHVTLAEMRAALESGDLHEEDPVQDYY